MNMMPRSPTTHGRKSQTMANMFTPAYNAIRQSIETHSIISMEYTDDADYYLRSVCDDHVADDARDRLEYWGIWATSGGPVGWRVDLQGVSRR
jgi:hypothetical protein